MQEAYLHYVWQYGLFDHSNLQTTNGEDVVIIQAGQHNGFDGPDFQESIIEINGQRWAGSVELHVRSADWTLHNHQHDPKYDNVLLHVVYQGTESVYTTSNRSIPTLELKDRMRVGSHQLLNRRVLKCGQWSSLKTSTIDQWQSKMVEERAALKVAELLDYYHQFSDWEHFVMGSFLMALSNKVNKVPFEMLGRSINYAVMCSHRASVEQLQALLLGQAGLLVQVTGARYTRLKQIYMELKPKEKLKQVNPALWNWKVRPNGSPEKRLEQLALLFNARFFDHALLGDYKTWREYLTRNIRLSENTVARLAVDWWLPIQLFQDKLMIGEYSMSYYTHQLRKLPVLSNKITEEWHNHEAPMRNALDAVGMIHLYNNRCKRNKCLSCAIGNVNLGNRVI